MPVSVDKARRIRELKDRLNYLGRYIGSISPKLARYKELQKELKLVREELEKIK